MSMRTLPLLFINLGGEMLYILDQRLRASATNQDPNPQNGVWTEADRRRVLNDIIGTMYSKDFMEELLKPQALYSHRALRTILTRLAHASIMRLNPASMDRLYELMVMAFKHQILLCPRPRDLLLISHNHMDVVREFVKDRPNIANQVDEMRRKIIEVYNPLSHGEFQLLRQTLLIFFQDMRVRVSLFLNAKLQNPSGYFALPTTGPVPTGTDVPGLIRVFNSKGREVCRREFVSGGSYTSPLREGSFDLYGDRVTRLGTNMYSGMIQEQTQTVKSKSSNSSSQKEEVLTPNPLAKEELNLLARLMGRMKVHNHQTDSETGFRVNLFSSDREEEEAGASGEGYEVINIHATQANSELVLIAGQFTDGSIQSDGPISKGDDLLAMMDEL